MQWQEIVSEKDKEIAELRKQVDWFKGQFKLLQSKQFGPSSEKSVELEEQTSLFNEPETLADPKAAEPDLEQIVYKRKKQAGKRELDFSKLPTEQIVHELPEGEQVCPVCGGKMHACGHEVVRRELRYVPAQYKVVEHVQTAYSCRNCEKNALATPMKKSEVPAGLIPGSGIVSPSLLAHILNNKYALALPLYRQEQEFQRIGVPASRQTMANWVIATHERWFEDFFQRLRSELLSNEILHADETTLTVLREDGRKATQKSYVWVYRTSGDSERPVVLYDYQPSRAGEHAKNFLTGFSGFLHTDGYEAYHCKLPPDITAVGCWAHMRRKFTDTLKTLPKDAREKHPAQTGLRYCNKLFELEAGYTEKRLSFQERFQARKKYSFPIAEEFFAWAKNEYDRNPVPKSAYGAALTYAVKQKEWLMHVFLDGRLELSNNRAERAVRPFAVGRKNWLFSNTPRGASASAVAYSIVETAKANGLRPFRYFQFLLERLPVGTSADDCAPWNDAAQDLCR